MSSDSYEYPFDGFRMGLTKCMCHQVLVKTPDFAFAKGFVLAIVSSHPSGTWFFTQTKARTK